MTNKIKDIFKNTGLELKIRLSYLLLVVPLVVLLVYCFASMQRSTRQYNEMINSAAAAGDFSLDFKKDFDYETYLLIVGNKSEEESELDNLLGDASRVISELEEITTLEDNINRLKGVKKYLANLEKYKTRIENNLKQEERYEENMQIWENDVQIVTSLIREEIFNYIFYEIRDMQTAREATEKFYVSVIRTSFIAGVIITLMLLYFSYFLPLSITRPINELMDVTDKVSKGDLSVRSNIDSQDELGVLSNSLNDMIDKINELLGQITKEQIRIREAELELLQSQINPHFLYNTLDTIVWLAEGGYQKEVVSMVKNLSAFFRTSISRGKEIISIEEELVHAGSYLEIQRFRYQDILSYEIDVADEFKNYLIPKITLQPLIENALYHGIKNKRGGGTIKVYAKTEGKNFALYVEDDGIGMTPERLLQINEGIETRKPSEKKIYGLYNVNERIRLKFGNEYGIVISSEYEKGTVSKITLPAIIEENIQLSE